MMGDIVLVMRRKAGETIVIGEGIEISVIEISPTRVKLGVTAPREVPVVRKETLVDGVHGSDTAADSKDQEREADRLT